MSPEDERHFDKIDADMWVIKWLLAATLALTWLVVLATIPLIAKAYG